MFRAAITEGVLGERIVIEHWRYSYVMFSSNEKGFTFVAYPKAKGDHHAVYPAAGKTQQSGIRYWKTIAGAKKGAIEFLS